MRTKNHMRIQDPTRTEGSVSTQNLMEDPGPQGGLGLQYDQRPYVDPGSQQNRRPYKDSEPSEDPGPYEAPERYEHPGPYEEDHIDSKFFNDPGKTQEVVNQVKFLDFLSYFTVSTSCLLFSVNYNRRQIYLSLLNADKLNILCKTKNMSE